MAGSSHRFKKHGPLEVWTVREKLSLGCSVMRNGDQNWVSVSRAVKLNAEPNRTSDWYSQKNCALQYGDMLEKVETHKRKRGDKDISGAETPVEQIVRKLTIERIEEIRKMIQEEQQRYKKLKKDIEVVKSGQLDDNLQSMWEEIQSSQKQKLPEESGEEQKRKSTENVPLMSLEVKTEADSDTESSTRDSMSDSINVDSIDEKMAHPGMLTLKLDSLQPPANPDQQVKPTPPPSPLLTTLLQSKQKSFLGLQQIKTEAEHEALMAQVSSTTSETVPEVISITTTPSISVKASTSTTPSTPSLPDGSSAKTLGTPVSLSQSSTPKMSTSTPILEIATDVNKDETDDDEDKTQPNSPIEIPPSPIQKEEQEKRDDQEEAEIVEILSGDKDDETEDGVGFISVDEEVSIKEDPLSPASSVSSKFSESDTKSRSVGRRRGKGRGPRGGRRNQRVPKRSSNEDDKKDDASSKHSEAETSDIDDDSTKDDDAISQSQLSNPLLFSESLPSSPASMSHCSDTEDEKAFKTWKKSIMLVWRAAATHKYANVFLHPVTNDIAPGYLNIVHRPMNLTTIKRNLESGIIRTTSEFQRDVMLMFTNAIMYNSSNHNVYKMAMEMYDDVLQHIEQYVSTQLMLQQSESKLLRTSRRTEPSDKSEDDSKKRKQSTDHPPDGGKSKKRKTRADD